VEVADAACHCPHVRLRFTPATLNNGADGSVVLSGFLKLTPTIAKTSRVKISRPSGRSGEKASAICNGNEMVRTSKQKSATKPIRATLLNILTSLIVDSMICHRWSLFVTTAIDQIP